MSLSFVLATGVGKTRLMGTFITYLYTNHNIKNFFIVAPGTTVYNKLKKDLGDMNSPKYVFKGVGCFNEPPRIIADDDYRNKRIDFSNTGVNICIFNISKFDKENVKIKAVNEVLGDSFYSELSKLNDLVVIMDESHHYHADKGAIALNELKPVLGLELTATPYYNKGSKQTKFKNAVYEYPLSKSIADGYTRTPYAVTRRNINSYNFGDEELDKIMLSDGILCHERIKLRLENYAKENGEILVKPFMMVVCKDTDHATKVYEYVTSDAFCDGKYKNKTLLIHSNRSKAVREANVEKLLNLESPENTVEIVIHVDMLKEGWDVNNLYTIVPLRTASSKILREQMIGRGLRLPYGKRTGVKEIDSVMLTAHVANWLRPNPNEFKIYYNNGKRYEPDFVVETAESIYLVEVKGENMLNDPDVIAKKERAEQYCKIASEWGKANNYKDWKYLFIPAGQIQSNSSFMNLAQRFGVLAFKTA